jgi:hypothetical protein
MPSGEYSPKFANWVEIRAPLAAGSCVATKTAGGFGSGDTASYTIDDRVKSVDITRIAQRKDAYE